MGVVHIAPDAKWNEARIYSPSSPVRVYEKHHMLPPFESPLKPGTTRTLWKEPSGIWGVTICKDMDFPAMGRDYANDGAGLLLVPAWDFVGDGWLHGRMAILRGVESGFSIARAPKQGILNGDRQSRTCARRANYRLTTLRLARSECPGPKRSDDLCAIWRLVCVAECWAFSSF